jgi:DNA-binding MarR family transcriptional regulator
VEAAAIPDANRCAWRETKASPAAAAQRRAANASRLRPHTPGAIHNLVKSSPPQPAVSGSPVSSGSETTDDFHLQEWPFYWLTRASGRYLETLEAALKGDGLDVPRWRVLMSLHGRDCASVSEIAEQAIVKLPTMTKIVQRMQADGLVVCRPRETDGRVTEVLLTESGRRAQALAWSKAASIYEEAFRNISDREVQTLNRLMGKIFHNLD